VYDLVEQPQSKRYQLTRVQTVYTQFTEALLRITNPDPGPEEPFLKVLQRKLAERQSPGRLGQTTAIDLNAIADADHMVVDED